MRVEPLADAHAPDLRAACAADRTIWYERYPTCCARDRVAWTGRGRDTVSFSILSAERPGARAGLDARLAAYS